MNRRSFLNGNKHRVVCRCFFAVFLATSISAFAEIYNYNFGRSNEVEKFGMQYSDGRKLNAGDYTIENNKLRVKAEGLLKNIAILPKSPSTATNISLQVEVLFKTIAPMSIAFRTKGPYIWNALYLSAKDRRIYFSFYNRNINPAIITSQRKAYDFKANTVYIVKLLCSDNSYVAKIWKKGETEPKSWFVRGRNEMNLNAGSICINIQRNATPGSCDVEIGNLIVNDEITPADMESIKSEMQSANIYERYLGVLAPPALCLETPLLTPSEKAVIVVSPALMREARDLNESIKKLCGQALDIKADTQINFNELKKTVVVIGNFENNKLIEYFYKNYLAFVDTVIPGQEGYIIQTVHDPFKTKANVIILGISSGASWQLVKDRFLTLCKNNKTGDAISFKKRIYEIKKSKEIIFYSSKFYTFSNYWEKRGYLGADSAAIMKYLITGDRQYLEKFKTALLDRVKKGRAPEHLYSGPLYTAFGMVVEDEIFSDEERGLIFNYMLRSLDSDECLNFIDIQLGLGELKQNHGIRASWGLLAAYNLFGKYYARELAKQMASWKRTLDDFWLPQLASSKASENTISQHEYGGSLEEMYAFSLMRDEWADIFIKKGHAQEIAERMIMLCNNFGYMAQSGDNELASEWPAGIFSKAAWLFNDGKYLYMIDKRRKKFSASDDFGRSFKPSALVARVPDDHIGIKVAPLSPLFYKGVVEKCAYFDPMKVNISNYQEGFDVLTLREGMDRNDGYFLLNGLSGGNHAYDRIQEVTEYSKNGKVWITGKDAFIPPLYEHNTLNVIYNGFGEIILPAFAKIIATNMSPACGFIKSRVNDHNNTDWDRNIFERRNKYFVIFDEITAKKDGDFNLQLVWKIYGEPKITDGCIHAEQRNHFNQYRGVYIYDYFDLRDGLKWMQDGVYDNEYNETVKFLPSKTGGEAMFKFVTPGKNKYKIHAVIDKSSVGKYTLLLDDKKAMEYSSAAGSAGSISNYLGEYDFSAQAEFALKIVNTDLLAGTTNVFALQSLVLEDNSADYGQPLLYSFDFLYPQACFTSSYVDTDKFATKYKGRLCAIKDYSFENKTTVLNEFQSVSLKSGAKTSFANLFYASGIGETNGYGFHEISGGTILVDGQETAYIGIASQSKTIGKITVDADFFFISADYVYGVNLRKLAWENTPLLAELKGNEFYIADKSLSAKIKNQILGDITRLRGLKTKTLKDEDKISAINYRLIYTGAENITALAFSKNGEKIYLGTEKGKLISVNAGNLENKTLLDCGQKIWQIVAEDIDGNGENEILCGGNSQTVYALDGQGQIIWKRELPFAPCAAPHFTFKRESIVRMMVDDLDNDGKKEIVIGTGNSSVFKIDYKGAIQFKAMRDQCGVIGAFGLIDLNNDGVKDIVRGMKYKATCEAYYFINGRDGTQIGDRMIAGGWATAGSDIVVYRNGGNAINMITGNTKGNINFWNYTIDSGAIEMLYTNNIGCQINEIKAFRTQDDIFTLVSAQSGYLYKFLKNGKLEWKVSLAAPVLKSGWSPNENLIYATCEDGAIYAINMNGSINKKMRLPSYIALTGMYSDTNRKSEYMAFVSKKNELFLMKNK